MPIVCIFIFHRHETPMNKEFQEEGERLKDKNLFCYRLILSFPFLSIRPASISCPQASGWLRSYTLTSTVCSITPKKTGKACYWRHPVHHLNLRCLNEGLGKRKNRIDHRGINGRDICFLLFQVLSDSNNKYMLIDFCQYILGDSLVRFHGITLHTSLRLADITSVHIDSRDKLAQWIHGKI